MGTGKGVLSIDASGNCQVVIIICFLHDFVKHICKCYIVSFSTKPLFHGIFTAVVLMIIAKLMHVNVLLEDSPSLSIKNLFGDSNVDIQFMKTSLAMALGCLFGMTTNAESLSSKLLFIFGVSNSKSHL